MRRQCWLIAFSFFRTIPMNRRKNNTKIVYPTNERMMRGSVSTVTSCWDVLYECTLSPSRRLCQGA